MCRLLPAFRPAALLLVLILLTACAAPAASPTAAPTAAPDTATVIPSSTVSIAVPPTVTAPTLQPAQQALTVFAAASLTECFGEMGKLFEMAHPGVRVVLNFAGSQQLRAQLEQGAQADVFASANTKEMNAAVASSLIISGTQKTFARNRLVVIFPVDNPGKIATLADLAKPGLKLVVADNAVPVGQYTLDMLVKMNRDPAYGANFSEKVQKNVVPRENDVKAVVSKVRLGEADAGVVYSTDVTSAAAADVTPLVIPDQFNQLATYPIAALTKTSRPELAQQFVDLVLSDVGQELLSRYGFISEQAR